MKKTLVPSNNKNDRKYSEPRKSSFFGSGVIKDPSAPDGSLAEGINVNVHPHAVKGRTGARLYSDVKIPAIVNNSSDDNAGWLEFGRPDYPLPKDFDPIVTARMPDEGSALFFPSYFFHGTIPFTGTEDRIGIAFDVYPQ